ncbi:MAG: hypothetical protein GY853_16525 [PVC group bacterium]|nr:hypothetical protein [PVC group bacterium]
MTKIKCPKCDTIRPYKIGNKKVNCSNKDCKAQIKVCDKNIVEQKKQPTKPKVPISTKIVPKVPIKVPKSTASTRTKQTNLNHRTLLTAVNNYLKGYKRAYERVESDMFSETKRKYEEMLKEKDKLERML